MIDFVINKSARFTDIIPLLAGEQICPPRHSFGPYVRSHYLIHYCLSGKGAFRDPRGEHTVNEGEIFVIRPSGILPLGRVERNPEKVVEVYQRGRADAMRAMDDLQRWLSFPVIQSTNKK